MFKTNDLPSKMPGELKAFIQKYCSSNVCAMLDMYFLIRLYDRKIAVELFGEAIKEIMKSATGAQVYCLVCSRLAQAIIIDGTEPFIKIVQQLDRDTSSCGEFRLFFMSVKMAIAYADNTAAA